MFGFMCPREENLRYRSVYSRCCQHLRYHFGLRSAPFHSYEAVFLYACALDAGLVPEGVIPSRRCCGLRRLPKPRSAPDYLIGRYCASVGVLLTDIKLTDDVNDNSSWLARVVRFFLKAPIYRARSVIRKADAGAAKRIEGFLREHGAMEAAGNPVPMADYVRPTAAAFGYVFGLLGNVCGSDSFRASVTAIGEELGASLIAYDCAADWEADRKSGSFNPIPGRDGVGAAFAYSADRLARTAELCRAAFGEGALSATVAESVREHALELAKRAGHEPAPGCVAATQERCGTATSEARERAKAHGFQPGNPAVLYQDCGGGGGGAACCAIICCAMAVKGACGGGQKQSSGCCEDEKPKNDGCCAQNERTGCCGEKRTTTNVGCCEVDNQGAAESCCKIGMKGGCK
jgi:hypothetical protein